MSRDGARCAGETPIVRPTRRIARSIGHVTGARSGDQSSSIIAMLHTPFLNGEKRMPMFSFGGSRGQDLDAMEAAVNEMLEENPADFFVGKPEAKIEHLDRLHELYQDQRQLARLGRIMARLVPHCEATASVVFAKIAELEAQRARNEKPIATDSRGVSTLPTFDAEALNLDGLNDKAA